MSLATLVSLIPSTVFPSKPRISTLPSLAGHHHHHQLEEEPRCSPQFRTEILSRRDAAVLISAIALVPFLRRPAPAAASSFGFSGPKGWLKEQKKKSYKFLLAPVDASRNSLRSAYLLLNSGSDNGGQDLEEVQKLLRSAARDCVPQERNSFVTFQANTGVEVCTFRLIVKNASSLLDDKDPIKLEAEAKLSNLISSFVSLNGVVNESDVVLASSRQKVADALLDTISWLDKFEQGIKDCLEV